VRTLFEAYLAGDSMNTAAEKMGIQASHSEITRMLTNVRYAGDEYYPAIISRNTLVAAAEERLRRAERLGRMREETEQFDDPFQQAEYAYSMIETEVSEDGSE
jgi:hypothetical protein